jgi:3-hydroxyacyl-[acyl-carrier-protein] dehydratase
MPVRAGDQLKYTAKAEVFQPDGAMCSCTSHVGDQLQGEFELFFAHLDERFAGVDLFRPEELLQMLRIFRLFEVGRRPDGEPISIPEFMLAAEREWLAGDG